MSKYLIRTTEMYRCDSEEEATNLIKSAKQDPKYTVVKHSVETKYTKAKGEIVDEWKRVTLTKDFTDEKEPDGILMPVYSEPMLTAEEDE